MGWISAESGMSSFGTDGFPSERMIRFTNGMDSFGIGDRWMNCKNGMNG